MIKGAVQYFKIPPPSSSSSMASMFKNEIPASCRAFLDGVFASQGVQRSSVTDDFASKRVCRMMTLFHIIHYHFNPTVNLFQSQLGTMISISSRTEILKNLNDMGITISAKSDTRGLKDKSVEDAKIVSGIASIYNSFNGAIIAVDNLDKGIAHVIAGQATPIDQPTDITLLQQSRVELIASNLISEEKEEAKIRTTKETDRVRHSNSLANNVQLNTRIDELCSDRGEMLRARTALMVDDIERRKGGKYRCNDDTEKRLRDKLLNCVHGLADDSREQKDFDTELVNEINKMWEEDPSLTITDQAASRFMFHGFYDGKAGDVFAMQSATEYFVKQLDPTIRYWESSDGQVFIAHHKWQDTLVEKQLVEILSLQDGLKTVTTAAQKDTMEGQLKTAKEKLVLLYQHVPMQLGGLHAVFTLIRGMWKVNGGFVYEAAADWLGLGNYVQKMKDDKNGFNKLNVEFFMLIQQAWLGELMVDVADSVASGTFPPLSQTETYGEYLERYCNQWRTMRLYHQALFTEVNVLLDLWHARELRGRDASLLYYSGLKRMLRLVVVGSCPQYVKDILFELRQTAEMDIELKKYYLTNQTCCNRYRKNDAGGLSTCFIDEYLEMYLIKVAKGLMTSDEFYKVMSTGEMLNVLSGNTNSLNKYLRNEDLGTSARTSSNKLKSSFERLALLRAVFRKDIIAHKVLLFLCKFD